MSPKHQHKEKAPYRLPDEHITTHPSASTDPTIRIELEQMLAQQSPVEFSPLAAEFSAPPLPIAPKSEQIAATGLMQAGKVLFSRRARIERAQHRVNTVRSVAQTITEPRGQVGAPITEQQANKKIGWEGVHKTTITDRDASGEVILARDEQGDTRINPLTGKPYSAEFVNPYRPATRSERWAARRLSNAIDKKRAAAVKAAWLRKSYPQAGTTVQTSLSGGEARRQNGLHRRATRLENKAQRQQAKFDKIAASDDLPFTARKALFKRAVNKRAQRIAKANANTSTSNSPDDAPAPSQAPRRAARADIYLDRNPNYRSPGAPDQPDLSWEEMDEYMQSHFPDTEDNSEIESSEPVITPALNPAVSETLPANEQTQELSEDEIYSIALNYIGGTHRKGKNKGVPFPVMSDESFKNQLATYGIDAELADALYLELQYKGYISKTHVGGVGFEVLRTKEDLKKDIAKLEKKKKPKA
jgi:hypothetical protein